MKLTGACFGVDGLPGRLFTRDQVMTFQSEACFPRALFGTSVVLFESPNEKIAATRD